MKNVFYLIIAMLISPTGYSQVTFTDIKVNGAIEIVRTGQKLLTGLEFSEKEKLNFKTTTSTAAVINSQKGRMILQPDNIEKNKANYLPAMGNISTRSVAISNVEELRKHFSGKYVIINSTEILISLPEYPMNEENFFYIQYDYNGEEINKKLKHEQKVLIIDKNELFKVDGNTIAVPDNIKLRLYYVKDNKVHTLISEFSPIIPDLDLLKNEVKIILDELEGKDSREKVKEVTGYIFDFYGNVDEDSVKKWLNENFDL
jgi:hypothetical protein